MGCDIHCWAEVLKDGKWKKVGDVFDDPYYNPKRKLDEYNQPKTDSPYHDRNYDLFAILADVRNGHGFAGIPTGEGFVPISDPKGLPSDISEGILSEADKWCGDGHSHSWHTLRALQDYDWDQRTKAFGVIPVDSYEAWVKAGRGCPRVCSSWVSGQGVEVLEEASFLKFRDANELDPSKKCYVRISWGMSYREAVGSRFFKVMETLAGLGSPDSVRIVFFFDN